MRVVTLFSKCTYIEVNAFSKRAIVIVDQCYRFPFVVQQEIVDSMREPKNTCK